MSALFDSHCHLDFPQLANDLEAELAAARVANVTGWLIPGTEPAQWERLGAFAGHSGVRLAVGLHPWWVGDVCSRGARALEDALRAIERKLGELGAVAVGECGLDARRAARDGTDLSLQLEAFEAQLVLARERSLPIVLHVVDAHGAALTLLRRVGPLPAGGVVHGFTGSEGLGREYLALGLYVGLGCQLTSAAARRVREAAARLPLERLLLETDAPDQRPRGGAPPCDGATFGRPRDLAVVAACLAELRGVALPEVAARTHENALALFGS